MATVETPAASSMSLEPGGTPDPISTTSSANDDVSSVSQVATNRFLQREARRMARYPCLYFWTAFLLSTAIAITTIMAGGMTKIEASSKGWTTRGTTIADRQAASLLVRRNRKYLATGGDDAWNDLIDNIQPSWESDRDLDAFKSAKNRRLDGHAQLNHRPQQSIKFGLVGEAHGCQIHTTSNQNKTRQLVETFQSGFGSCDASVYNSKDFARRARLWPIWKSISGESLLGANQLYEICVGERNTLQLLSERGLCFGCKSESDCLPPLSIVLLARLVVSQSVGLTCEELRDAWSPFQASTETQLKTCIADIKETASYGSASVNSLPISCPFGFSPHMVDSNFENQEPLLFTSSIFVTDSDKLRELYASNGRYDRGGKEVEAAYDTQKETFNLAYQNEALQHDITLAFGATVSVVIVVLIHTKSLLLTTVTVLQIILCFPLAHFVYTFVCGYSFFPILNFIGLFVAFALGSDDVFVAVDKWKNARINNVGATTEEIAGLALPDAARAMFLTSLTTAIAFFATANCRVAPIKLFAIFVGLLVVLVYILCILLVFPALCIYDKSRQRKHKPCGLVVGQWECEHGNMMNPTEQQGIPSSLIVRFMKGYNRFVFMNRCLLLVCCFIATVLCLVASTKLKAPQALDVRLLNESNEFERNYRWRGQLLNEDMVKSAASISYVFWGVKPADTGDHGKPDNGPYFTCFEHILIAPSIMPDNPDSFTQLLLDETFDPSSAEAQLFLLDFCNDFYSQPFASVATIGHECPISGFDRWLRKQKSFSDDDQDEIFRSVCNSSAMIPMDKDLFHPCVAAWARKSREGNAVLRNDEVLILSFPFRAQYGYTDSFHELAKEFWDIEHWIKDKLRSAPQGVNKAFFTGNDYWYMDTHQAMTSTAYSSAATALIATTLVILISSRSFLLTFFSVLSMFYILAATIATMVLCGWTLGFIESICIAILIGISADFVTHLSVAYTTEEGNLDREKRTEQALLDMGPSILAAAFTTIVSSVIMIFTKIVFFGRFAYVMLFTISHSTFGAFIVFCTLTNCAGPSNPSVFLNSVKGTMQSVYRQAQERCTSPRHLGQDHQALDSTILRK